MKSMRSVLGALLASLALLGGCATVAPPGGPAAAVSKSDPFESFNRKVFAFNEAVDDAVLKPVAEAYRKVVPSLVRQGVTNFFGNIGDLWSATNHLLQGKVANGLDMGFRVAVNTVFGFAGVLDIATETGNVRKSEDFGQTLAVWGVPSGPYLVLPLFGPSTVRDAAALPVDRYYNATSRYIEVHNTYALTGLSLVNLRADLLDASKLADQVSLDKYSFFRDAWFSRRLDAIYDGAAPLESFDDEADEKKPEPKKK